MAEATTEGEDERALDHELGGRCVLVVDDDEDFRSVVAAALARHGLDVETAANADEAFQSCVARRPELILMDVQMPGRSGLQACTTFRQAEQTRGVPVILMSAHWGDEYQLVRAFDCGADDVLTKGQSALELMARVRAVLLLSTVRRRLADARREVEELEGFLAVCAACKRVRDEGQPWVDIEAYVRRLSGREITHGVCPECRERLYGRPGTS